VQGADNDAIGFCNWPFGTRLYRRNSSTCRFAVVDFSSGYCRVWTDTAFGPQDGRYLWFLSTWGWHYRFRTFEGADIAMHRAVAQQRCHHWWQLPITLTFGFPRPVGLASSHWLGERRRRLLG
jgi:hypothetical protein